MSCLDSPCCGCCAPMTELDHIEAAEAYREIRDAYDHDAYDEPSDAPGSFQTDGEADGHVIASDGRAHRYADDMQCAGYDVD